MLLLFRPKTAAELEDDLLFLEQFKIGINQFQENLKNGIRTGMVGSVTVCKEGKQCLEDTYVEIASQKSGRGILAAFTNSINSFLSKMSPDELANILEKHGVNATALVEDSVIKNVGSPLAGLFEYLEKEHLPHCLPSNVSSGLGTLPVDHVYFNGNRTLERTNTTLNGGDSVMPGKESYGNFLSFSTTQNITPGNHNQIARKSSFWEDSWLLERCINSMYPVFSQMLLKDLPISNSRRFLTIQQSFLSVENVL